MTQGVNRQGEAAGEAASRPSLRSWGLPAFAGALGVAMLLEATTLQLFDRYTKLGPGFLVAVVGAGLVVLALCLAWQVRSGVTFDPEAGEGVDPTMKVSLSGLSLAAAGVVLPIATMPWLGFPLGGALAYACVTRAYGSTRPLLDVAIGFVLASVTWLAFTKLGVQLGPFWSFGGKA